MKKNTLLNLLSADLKALFQEKPIKFWNQFPIQILFVSKTSMKQLLKL